jgi:hypothetical protein
MENDKELKLECLRLACAQTKNRFEIIAVAESYHDFVKGEVVAKKSVPVDKHLAGERSPSSDLQDSLDTLLVG